MPTSVPSASQEEVQGLRNEGQWNPVLPSSPEDEQLTAILSSRAEQKPTKHTNPEYQQDFTGENSNYGNFGFSDAFLADVEFDDAHLFRTGTGMTQDEPMSATSITNRSLRTVSRKSTGLANMSSQLMSPVLTDIASPGSTGVADSPIIHHKVLGGGLAEDMSSIDTHGNSSHTFDTSGASKTSTNTSTKSQTQPGTATTHKSQLNRKRRGSEPTMQEPDDDFVIVENHTTTATTTPRHGIAPASRAEIAETEVETLTEQADKRAVKAKNADISRWLSRNELSPADHAHLSGINTGVSTRRRSRSTGDAIILPPHILPQAPIEEEHSGDEGNDSDFGSYHEEAPASFATKPVSRPKVAFDETEEEIKPTDAFPWVDPIRFPSEHGTVGQPGTANEAMMKFLTKSRDIETASRAATWGTQRRGSDGDAAWTHPDREMHRIWGHGGLLSRLSLTREKEEEYKEEWRHFKEHAKEKAARWLPKRDSLPRPAELIRSPSKDSYTSPAASIKSKRESTHDLAESLKARLHRHSYSKKPKSPDPESHGHDALERSSSPSDMYSMGHNHSFTGFAHAISGRLSRHGSKDDGHHLASLWKTQSGGPPVTYPKLSQSPPNRADSQFKSPSIANTITNGAQVAEPTTLNAAPIFPSLINTGFTLDRQLPIPTLEGFKIDARRKLPLLPPFLVDRLALEQLRRYKKLVEFKAKHAKLVATNSCPSGIHCIAGEAHVTIFPAKAQKEPVSSQLGVNMSGDADDDDDALDDGFLTENSFPPGMPAIPAKRLPAQFECPLCFQVKKFTKPSDWSKHVHEDLQPFTCTFMECPEPKSFKRKADWVRHENERHRHLEWWQCTEEGCSHHCYRRDNFVQHLCREHKMPEPKAKNIKADNKPAVRGPAKTKGKGNIEYTPENKVLWMVENCKHDTRNRAIDEPCRLCGRAFNTWKKLTVDLAKHMEELSLPVLELVNQKLVNTETVVSPIDVKPTQFKTGQSPYSNSSNISPFDPPMTISSGMSDLPGAFAPMPVSTQFQTPHFDSVAWNDTQNQSGSTVFPGQLNTWPAGDIHYSTQADPMFAGGNATGFAHVQHQADPSNFTPMSSAMLTQGLHMNYQDDSSLLAEMNVSPGYTGPHFPDLASSQPMHHSPPIGYNTGDLHGSYMNHNTQQSSNPLLYNAPGEEVQMQQGQGNGAHMQQQQQQQQRPSQQFYQPSY